MLVWLLVLLLLFTLIYVVYRLNFIEKDDLEGHEDEHHYTFKI